MSLRPVVPSLLALAIACAIASAPPPAADAPPPSASAIRTSVLQEANRARRQEGLAPLRDHPVLDAAAQGHVEELAERGELDHVSRDPARATLDLRLKLAGVTAWRRIGENLAYVRNPQIDPAREFVRLWLMSAPHRANLLEPAFDRAGTGVAHTADGRWYVVQVYGRGIEAEPVAR